MNDIRQYMNEHQICVIMPTYNNGTTVLDIIQRVNNYTDNLIVVNDGSTDDTSKLLSRFSSLKIVSHSHNEGKGRALMDGFVEAIQEGYKFAVTIDADGQHYPEDLPLFIAEHQAHPDRLIVGERHLDTQNMRQGSSFANKFSNFWFNFQTGLRLNDTQSGYRLYPLHAIKRGWPITSRYEAELELLVFCAWSGVPVGNLPCRVYYPPKEERVSSFRPFRDFMRITVLNTILTFVAILYIKPKKLFTRRSTHE